ncbi:condensation domain-containing protein [Actinophytocola sp.]|uniref:condensation domain-containing protein n=1 Tax=Actinophytocola sp. TaxID=1872138 RepID=UPI003D6C319A
MTVERSFPLNAAQLRNLRNWAESERADRTVVVVVAPTRPMNRDRARAAVTELVRRHRALRSRLAEDADGTPVQQVVTAPAAEADLALVETDARPAYAPERVDPAERALRGSLYLSGGRVVLVKLSLSHLFTDGFGAHAVIRELRQLLAGEPLPAVPRQAGEVGADPAAVRRDTERWKGLLGAAPRSVTYSGVAREEYEKAWLARVPLDPEDAALLTAAGRGLRVTPYVLWATAISALVSRVGGQHRQVFRSTYANRFAADDFRVVDQLAQAVYVPIEGEAGDSLRTRAERVAVVSLRTYRRGHYDANELLRWLNEPARSRGALFQPAFELNYVPAAPVEARGDTPPAPMGSEPVDVRVDPRSAKADLAVTVSHLPGPVLRLSARRPVAGQREPEELAAECLAVLRVLCTSPDTPVAELPVEPFPATAGLHAGHHGGALVDLDTTRRLVLSVPGIGSCELQPRGDRLTARVTANHPVAVPDLLRELRDRQPWWSGSVVPDDLVVR